MPRQQLRNTLVVTRRARVGADAHGTAGLVVRASVHTQGLVVGCVRAGGGGITCLRAFMQRKQLLALARRLLLPTQLLLLRLLMQLRLPDYSY